MPYAQAITGRSRVEGLALQSINVLLVMLLVLVCANVALLMFARAATRESELVVRDGARRDARPDRHAAVRRGAGARGGRGRRRAGAAGFRLRWWLSVSEIEAGGRLPFWFNAQLAPMTVLYAGGLTLLGAVIAGVVPALKVTGRRVEARLRQATAGGGGLRFGGVWTAVIVAQVAVTVGFPGDRFLRAAGGGADPVPRSRIPCRRVPVRAARDGPRAPGRGVGDRARLGFTCAVPRDARGAGAPGGRGAGCLGCNVRRPAAADAPLTASDRGGGR